MTATVEEGLFLYLTQNTAIQATLPENGLFMGYTPEGAPNPSLMFKKISGNHDTTLNGPSGYAENRFQFTATASDVNNTPGSGYVSSQLLISTLRQQLNGLNGTLPNGVRLFNSILDNDLDYYDEDDQEHQAVQDYIISWQQNP